MNLLIAILGMLFAWHRQLVFIDGRVCGVRAAGLGSLALVSCDCP